MTEDYEPDPPECQLNDAFLEALTTGDHSAAADALRELKLLGGSLDGVTLELLADLLVGTAHRHLFPCRLVIGKRRRGRPAVQKKVNGGFSYKTRKFLNAIASGDKQAAADNLRHMSSLGAAELEILADLFDDNPQSDLALRYRFKLVRYRRGNPAYLLESKAKAFVRNLLVENAGVSKKEAGIEEAMQKTGNCRATIQKARRDCRRTK